ncbi:RNA ligase partner protein [Methanolobus halotolerans]|uniref:RNA-free ribonuclease P n=1 Tax=Methanolobus halotolerans TaxID=2052935 RepID=A0A4E0Q066_9EURY|nr:RNA ligase partner protein [Methanolobus halotolerans]TGC09712.1 RNA ligase partner protein [Methanolobus halotolerans]
MLRQRFVLDTTALTDLYAREKMGIESMCDGMRKILELIASARMQLGISCYVPFPSVYNELREFAQNNVCDQDVIAKIDTWLVKKAPDRYNVQIPSKVFHEYVSYMRERINKGMTIAEETIWNSSTECLFITTKADNKKDIDADTERRVIGGHIGKFRNKYRSTMRYGILDSAPDIDVLILAKELEAAVVASDFGIQKWAEELGVRFVPASTFPMILKEYLEHASMANILHVEDPEV